MKESFYKKPIRAKAFIKTRRSTVIVTLGVAHRLISLESMQTNSLLF